MNTMHTLAKQSKNNKNKSTGSLSDISTIIEKAVLTGNRFDIKLFTGFDRGSFGKLKLK